jgi:hypothetical protein
MLAFGQTHLHTWRVMSACDRKKNTRPIWQRGRTVTSCRRLPYSTMFRECLPSHGGVRESEERASKELAAGVTVDARATGDLTVSSRFRLLTDSPPPLARLPCSVAPSASR